MSRIRTTKPEFWSSDQITSMSRDARLMFIGIWNFCDDSGIHPNNIRTLKAEIYPLDEDITLDHISKFTHEMSSQGLIVTYKFGGKPYLRVTGWKHQKIDRPTFKHPWPCGTIPTDKSEYEQLVEQSTNVQRAVDEPSPPEGKGIKSSLCETSRRGSDREGPGGKTKGNLPKKPKPTPSIPDCPW